MEKIRVGVWMVGWLRLDDVEVQEPERLYVTWVDHPAGFLVDFALGGLLVCLARFASAARPDVLLVGGVADDDSVIDADDNRIEVISSSGSALGLG